MIIVRIFAWKLPNVQTVLLNLSVHPLFKIYWFIADLDDGDYSPCGNSSCQSGVRSMLREKPSPGLLQFTDISYMSNLDLPQTMTQQKAAQSVVKGTGG
jgi:hypothetical protein